MEKRVVKKLNKRVLAFLLVITLMVSTICSDSAYAFTMGIASGDAVLTTQTTDSETAEEIAEEAEAEEEVAADVVADASGDSSIMTTLTIDGTMISIYAENGAFPVGTTVDAKVVEAADYVELVNEAIEENAEEEAASEEDMKAFDISFYYNGEEIEPAEGKSVAVSFTGEDIAEDAAVFHIEETDANGNELEEAVAVDMAAEATTVNGEDGVRFETESFSVYVIYKGNTATYTDASAKIYVKCTSKEAGHTHANEVNIQGTYYVYAGTKEVTFDAKETYNPHLLLNDVTKSIEGYTILGTYYGRSAERIEEYRWGAWTNFVNSGIPQRACFAIIRGRDATLYYYDQVWESVIWIVQPDPSVSMEGWTYGTEASEPKVTSTRPSDNVTFTYEKKVGDGYVATTSANSGASKENGKPVLPGTYRVTATFPARENYAETSAVSEDFTIDTQTVELYTSRMTGVKVNGAMQYYVSLGTAKLSEEFYYNSNLKRGAKDVLYVNADFATSSTRVTKADAKDFDTLKSCLQYANDEMQVLLKNASCVKITPQRDNKPHVDFIFDNTVSVGNAAEVIYDGQEHEATVTQSIASYEGVGTQQVSKMEYSNDNGKTWVETKPVNAGSYLVRATLSAAPDRDRAYEYKGKTVTGTFTIAPQEVGVKWVLKHRYDRENAHWTIVEEGTPTYYDGFGYWVQAFATDANGTPIENLYVALDGQAATSNTLGVHTYNTSKNGRIKERAADGHSYNNYNYILKEASSFSYDVVYAPISDTNIEVTFKDDTRTVANNNEIFWNKGEKLLDEDGEETSNIFAFTKNEEGAFFSISYDGGETWSEPAATVYVDADSTLTSEGKHALSYQLKKYTKDENGKLHFVGYVRDITATENAEHTLGVYTMNYGIGSPESNKGTSTNAGGSGSGSGSARRATAASETTAATPVAEETGTPQLATPAAPVAAVPAATPAATPVEAGNVEASEEPTAIADEASAANAAPVASSEEATTTVEEEASAADEAVSAWGLINLIAMLLVVFEALALILAFVRKRSKKQEGIPAFTNSEILKLVSLPVAIAAVLAFFLTQDLAGIRVLADSWTPCMVILAIAQTVLAFFAKKVEAGVEEV